MKKLLLGALMAMGIFGTAQASELYWMIASDAKVDGASAEWSVAKIYASADGSNFGVETPIESWTRDEMSSIYGGYAITTIEDSMTSFYVELWDANEENKLGQSFVSMSDPKQGATQTSTLLAANAIDMGGGMAMTSPYSFSQFTTSQVVPEPTTGLLMLFGLAGLALRRRRA